MRAIAPVFAALLAACSFGGGQDWGGGGKGKWGGGGSSTEPATIVELAAIETGSVSDRLLTNAIVESEFSANLVPSASGVVLSVHRDEGDVVRRGDLLAVIENVSLDAGAERARAEVTRLETQAAEVQALASRGAVSQREVEDLEYQLQTARTSLREASKTFGNTRLTAPFDGVVAARTIKVGELASSGTAAFQIVDLTALRVIASLPERDVARVAVQQDVQLVSAYDDTMSAHGVVERIAPVIDAQSGTFRVTIALDRDQQVLKPGQFVSVQIEVDRHEDVVVVPRNAIVYEDGKPLVYRKAPKPEEDPETKKGSWGEGKASADSEKSSGGWGSWGGDKGKKDWGGGKDKTLESPWISERVPLVVGLSDEQHVEILEGVAVGDEIVVVGQSNLRDGAPILTPEMKAELEAEQADDNEAKDEEAASAEDTPEAIGEEG